MNQHARPLHDAPFLGDTLPADRIRRFVRSCHARMGGPLGEGDLEDAIQEALVQVWLHREAYRGTGSIDAWLYSVARHSVLGVVRARRRHLDREAPDAVGVDPAATGPGPATAADTALGRIVREELEDSGETISWIVLARDVGDASFEEIARRLSMSVTAVKSRYYRGLPGIRRRLQRIWRDVVGADADRSA